MIPQFPQFKKLEISDRAEIEAVTNQFPPYSDFNFTSLWSWNIGRGKSLSLLNNNLVLLFYDYITEEPFYTFIGQNEIFDTLEKLIQDAQLRGIAKSLKLISGHSLVNEKKKLERKFLIVEDRDNFDYVFSVNYLATLKGKNFETLRNLVNRLERRYNDVQVREINLQDDEVKREIHILTARWSQRSIAKGRDKTEIKNELESIQRHVAYSNYFSLISIGIYIEDQLVGFGTNEKIDDEICLAHYRKADMSFAGIYQYLEHKIAIILKEKNLDYLNFEQDLGIIPLRRAKESYRPVGFLPKYIINIKKLSYLYAD